MCGEANLPALEHEHDAVGRLLEVGDHGLAPLEQRPRIQPLEGAQLREAVFADRPARVEEPSPPPLLHPLGVELLGEEIDEPVVLRSDATPDAELVLGRVERGLRRVEPGVLRDPDRQVQRVASSDVSAWCSHPRGR